MPEKELLSVLDMSEDEQKSWCWFNIESVHERYYRKQDVDLADLAFRLRDEAMSSPKLYSAMLDVHQKVEGAAERSQDYVFWSMRAKPIHWIIAALIAKEKENE